MAKGLRGRGRAGAVHHVGAGGVCVGGVRRANEAVARQVGPVGGRRKEGAGCD